MDKRTLLALILSTLVIIATPMIFRTQPRPAADSTGASTPLGSTTPPSSAGGSMGVPAVEPALTAPTVAPMAARVDTIGSSPAQLELVSPGAAPGSIRFPSYRDLGVHGAVAVTLAQPPLPLIRYRLAVNGKDTIDLQQVAMQVRREADGVSYESASPAITITYRIAADGYLTHVSGTVAGAGPGSQLLIELPGDMQSNEADSLDDIRHFAYGYKRRHEDVSSVAFTKLDSTKIRTDSGPLDWVAMRDKYFMLALIAVDSNEAFKALRMQGGRRLGLSAMLDGAKGTMHQLTTANASAVLPLNNGAFAFDLYAGPQSWTELRRVGHDLENVNQYAGLLHPVVQPFATIMLQTLLWMKRTLHVNYGWVLVVFGVMIRLILWPLNQSAMRTNIKMQQIQPQLAEVQKRYAKDPDGQRDAMQKVYSDHGMSPLSPVMGCLPMLIPMPVLFALYFVFQNTIEFRGVPFLWLPDLSLRDPYYITPVVMGVSMFVLSWISMRAAPPAPQAKMMSYMMPVMFTFFFFRLASGLNLYYAVQNLTSLPQQWLTTRERVRAGTPSLIAPKRSLG